MKALSCHSPHVCGPGTSHQWKQSSIVLCWHACDFLVPPPPSAPQLVHASLFSDPATSNYFFGTSATSVSNLFSVRNWFSVTRKRWNWFLILFMSFYRLASKICHKEKKSSTLYFEGLVHNVINNSYFLWPYCVPGIALSTLQVIKCCYFYFMQEGTKAQRGWVCCLGHTALEYRKSEPEPTLGYGY